MSTAQFLVVTIGVAVALSIVMFAAWLIWRETRNSGWIDTTWTFGLAAVSCAGAVAALTSPAGFAPRIGIVAGLIALWGARLGLHIAQRTRGIVDDPRYAKLIREYGPNASQSMFWLAQKQAWVSIPLGLSMVLAAWNPVAVLRAQDWLGVAVLLVGICGEALADAQLRRFKADQANKGRICEVGLWRWSRHPNYFFEWLGWLAYPLIAIDFSGQYPWGFAALLGPVCMYWLLAHVSGVPPLEEHMLQTRGNEFRAYQSRTNAFFPFPPKMSEERP